jgi:hypothetical protein
MSLAEILNPDFVKELLESFETISNALQNVTRVGFDESSRLRVRAEYLDDGYIRVRDTSASIDILEMLREFSWTFYNLAESNKLLNDLAGALSSVGTDKLRASIVDSLPSGTNKIGSVDVASIPNPSNLDVALSTRASESTLSSFVGTPDSSPPSKGILLLGYDGSLVRRVKVTSDGKLLCQLG